ncbi:MAG: hypothetical protein RBG13Loki_0898 [Promethearchaeota archaeon CR_4]|nr:MAG: hypothetical protein RBG13Loki_0898 [Candidatus Lokiarchaeota archaeon CR_4]
MGLVVSTNMKDSKNDLYIGKGGKFNDHKTVKLKKW